MSEHTKATASDYAVSYGDWTLWAKHRAGVRPSIEVRRQFTQKVAAALNAADETERRNEKLREAERSLSESNYASDFNDEWMVGNRIGEAEWMLIGPTGALIVNLTPLKPEALTDEGDALIERLRAALNAADETERLRELLRRAKAWATDLEAMGVEICPADIETIADIYDALAATEGET